ncbi:uncharacterized protein DUF2829 [Paraburkholderia sp. BL23I1N1]|uniref:DUF2829 domain-containing protein n=1 Tax=Paraburkholderia sp. BL23I1N1 TaxID=1938802 RepID=UPI000E741E9E|nr:DUF2829 domain-containing protein [Paraburkholderia sp. BL23I1N1]RKE36657.1 uncharacterized protein DUF2829 [Paraburkholderia sp. BL23I1N1]
MTKNYIGTKIITAWHEERDGREGYAVKYEDGYMSWSPKETFEAAYRVIEGDAQSLTFGDAVAMLKAGMKVARSGWNGKGMFLFLVPGSTFSVNRPPLLGIYPEGTQIDYCPHIDMKTADGKIVPWLASQTDVMAEDWQVLG